MAYELTFMLSLGTSNTGISDLRAQLVDDAGSNVGSAVSTGFTEIGTGFYEWNYASIPDDHRGGVKFYSNAASSTILSAASINPEEAEYTDTAVSGLASTLSSVVSTLASTPANVWAVVTSSLTTAGTIGKLLVDNINATISSRSSHTAANVRSEMDSNSTQLAAIIVDTGTDIPALIAALNDLSAAQVNAEVDTALADYDGPTKAEMDSAFTEIKGATWATTDTLEAIRDRGDAAWTTAVGFSTHAAADVWEIATSGLTTAGTIGKLLVDNIDAAISSISIASIWNTLTNTLTTDGSIGKLLVSKMNLLTGPFETATSTTRDFTIIRAVTFTHTTDTLTVPGSWLECYVTSKCDLDDPDSAALFQIKVTDGGDAGDGLQRLNGAAATKSNGSVTVNADTVTFTLADDANAELAERTGAYYDVKFLVSGGTSERAKYGTHDVALTATRTV